jgi:tRNA-specific 2-thiouridylase
VGIEHHVIDLKKEFNEVVVRNFIEEYRAGRTPNPCVVCNPSIKWGLFVSEICRTFRLPNSEFRICTGHYARIKTLGSGQKAIFKAKDDRKDQTYMLWKLSQEQIQNTLFPLSEITKEETRKIASDLGLSIAEKKDSQDICFLEGKYQDFLAHFMDFESGDIVFEAQKIIGKHKGLPFYTIGQRKGLVPWSKPLFVQKIDHKNNAVVVTDDPEKLLASSFLINGVNWQHDDSPLNKRKMIKVQIRYNSHPVDVSSISKTECGLMITLKEPTSSITPGQSAVFYDEDMLLGGGIITKEGCCVVGM